jgi:hypothetical protein
MFGKKSIRFFCYCLFQRFFINFPFTFPFSFYAKDMPVCELFRPIVIGEEEIPNASCNWAKVWPSCL